MGVSPMVFTSMGETPMPLLKTHRLLVVMPAIVDVVARGRFQSAQRKVRNRVTGDDGAERECAFDRRRGEISLRRKISHHSACETVAGAGGVDDSVRGK